MSFSRLASYSRTIYKDKTSGDPSQVPASAVVDFYRQGGVITASATVPHGEVDYTLSVADIGRIRPGDQLFKNLDQTIVITVETVIDRQTLMVSGDDVSDLVLAAGDRLMIKSGRPTLYKNSIGASSYSLSQVETDATTGRTPPVYVAERFVDVIVSGTGITTYALIDQQTGQEYPVFNAQDMGGIQAAIDALPDAGGTVYIPAGTYLLTAGLQLNRPGVTLLGDGVATIIRPQTTNTFNLVTVNATHCQIRNLVLDGQWTSSSSGSYSCLVMNGLGVSGHVVLQSFLENLSLLNAPKHGLLLVDMILFTAINCEFVANAGDGVRISASSAHTGITTLRFISCVMSANGGRGLRATPDGAVFGVTNLTLFSCTFQSNRSGLGSSEGNAIEVNTSIQTTLQACYFEQAGASSGSTDPRAQQMVALTNCPTAIVDGCTFQGNADSDSPYARRPHRAIAFFNSALARLSNCSVQNMATEFAHFSDTCNDAVEFANRDLDVSGGRPRFSMDDGVSIIGMSRGALGIPTYATDGDRPSPTNVRKGSLIWVDAPDPDLGNSNLQVSNGSAWKQVTIAS
jgi:hypothetical protein